MKRRTFGRLAILGGVGAGIGTSMISCATRESLNSEKATPTMKKIIPRTLRMGDTIGLIAPGSPFSEKVYKRAITHLESLGLKIKESKNLHKSYGYLAGKDEDRVNDIHQMFKNPEVSGIWCIRGGYGTTRLLPDLDYELIKANPKVLIGYSDITALLNAIYLKTGLAGFHGPVAASEMTAYTYENVYSQLFNNNSKSTVKQFIPEGEGEEYKPVVIRPGKMSGELIGGNLSLLAAMAGTEFELDAKGKILFIEDVGEKPYRIDRMLTQLRQTANLKHATGILLGVFNGCQPGENDQSLPLIDTLKDRLGDLEIPVYYGFSFGHIDNNCTIPIGAKASFDTEKPILNILEAVTS